MSRWRVVAALAVVVLAVAVCAGARVGGSGSAAGADDDGTAACEASYGTPAPPPGEPTWQPVPKYVGLGTVIYDGATYSPYSQCGNIVAMASPVGAVVLIDVSEAHSVPIPTDTQR